MTTSCFLIITSSFHSAPLHSKTIITSRLVVVAAVLEESLWQEIWQRPVDDLDPIPIKWRRTVSRRWSRLAEPVRIFNRPVMHVPQTDLFSGSSFNKRHVRWGHFHVVTGSNGRSFRFGRNKYHSTTHELQAYEIPRELCACPCQRCFAKNFRKINVGMRQI